MSLDETNTIDQGSDHEKIVTEMSNPNIAVNSDRDECDSKSTTPSFTDAIDGSETNQKSSTDENQVNDKMGDIFDDYVPSVSAAVAKTEDDSSIDDAKIGQTGVIPEQEGNDIKKAIVDNESTSTLTKPYKEPKEIIAPVTESSIEKQREEEKTNSSSDNIDFNVHKNKAIDDKAIDVNDLESIDSEEQSSIIYHGKEEHEIKDQLLEEAPKTPIQTPNSKWFSFDKSDFNDTIQDLTSPFNMNLAYYRYQDKELELEQKSTNDKFDVKNSRNTLKKTFNEIKTGVTITQNSELINSIDWEFWSEVVNDYSNIVKNKHDALRKNITNGIPREIRGMVWQIICDSNSMKLKEFFINTKNAKSDYEKLIKRDLARTSFIKDNAVKEKIDDLFNIIKTYSIYDGEVGYTQGMAFITVPLLMNMESDEAFCMLVKLMFTYGFRDFYLPEMPGLHLRIYQFDRLIEDALPELYLHLKKQNIKSSMYALQWFLTLFAYKFPLDMVLRIYDVVIAEGLESILKFALNLMIKNNDLLLTLNFDDLLNFLKEKLFYCYLAVPDIGISEKSENGVLGNDDTTTKSNVYRIDEFIKDSMEINILPITLNKYSAEFDEIDKLEKQREEQVNALQSKNGLLTKEIRKIEASYALLNKEHVEIATEMVNGKMKIGSLEEDNKVLNEEIQKLKNRLENLTSQNSSGKSTVDFSGKLSQGLDKEIQNAMDINLKVMDENGALEEQLAELEEENRQLSANSHKINPVKIGSMFGLKKSGKFW